MRTWDEVGKAAEAAAELLLKRLGPPRIGVVLGSGFAPLAEALGCGPAVPLLEIPGAPPSGVPGHGGGVAAGSGAWVFTGRWHLYEGLSVSEVVFPVRVLRASGAEGVLLTCAAGALVERFRPGDLVLIADHLNLTGSDPVGGVSQERRDPQFLDLQGVYDPRYREAWRSTAAGALPSGILAAVRGPSFETPAEVRMLRALGGEVVSMSTVPEAIAARYLGLRVAALACVANAGAGLTGSSAIRHGDVVTTVSRTVEERSVLLAAGVAAMV